MLGEKKGEEEKEKEVKEEGVGLLVNSAGGRRKEGEKEIWLWIEAKSKRKNYKKS